MADGNRYNLPPAVHARIVAQAEEFVRNNPMPPPTDERVDRLMSLLYDPAKHGTPKLMLCTIGTGTTLHLLNLDGLAFCGARGRRPAISSTAFDEPTCKSCLRQLDGWRQCR